MKGVVRTFRQLYRRLREINAMHNQVLSINQRNLHYVYTHNDRKHFPIADNKLKTKELLANADIPLPKTYATFQSFFELMDLAERLEPYPEFVIKPASGSGGGGILVISGKTKQGDWQSIGGTTYSLEDLRKHISDIIFGVYSFDLNDQAIIEERIQQHPDVDRLSPHGLADVRLILCQNEPVLAMIRLATQDSHGTANLHQGAIGVGVDIATGITTHASQHGESTDTHPDSGIELLGHCIPYWSDSLQVGIRIAKQVPLKYIGVDIALSKEGPRLLEINARPGIEIQNVNATGMRPLLESITSSSQF